MSSLELNAFDEEELLTGTLTESDILEEIQNYSESQKQSPLESLSNKWLEEDILDEERKTGTLEDHRLEAGACVMELTELPKGITIRHNDRMKKVYLVDHSAHMLLMRLSLRAEEKVALILMTQLTKTIFVKTFKELFFPTPFLKIKSGNLLSVDGIPYVVITKEVSPQRANLMRKALKISSRTIEKEIYKIVNSSSERDL